MLHKRGMAHPTVSFEPTPNPATMKFLFSEKLIENIEHPIEYNHSNETDSSPLAAKIFGFPWTSAVFLGPDFVTVTKQDWVEWDVLAEPLAGIIQEHVQSGQPLVVNVPASQDNDENDSPLVKNIKEALNREIRPVVALDGGDVVFSRLEGGILYLQMKGACAGCPSSSATLKEGIEVRLKELFPEILEIQAV